MKRTDLDKLKGLRLKPQAGVPGAASAFGKTAPAAPSRREQRELDRAAGLVPFAVKLNEALVARLHTLAEGHEGGINAVVAELLEKGLGSKAK
jgi:hypothetical protein